jgi:beta-lactamase regulating signal transducer with metallopeptidase domain/uncharacterized membrane protein
MTAEEITQLNSWFGDWADLCKTQLWLTCRQEAPFILVAWLLCRFYPRLPASIRHWVWRLVYCKLLLGLFWITPISLPLLAPRPPAPHVAPAHANSNRQETPISISGNDLETRVQTASATDVPPIPSPTVCKFNQVFFPEADYIQVRRFVWTALCLLYLFGVACCMGALTRQMLALRRLRRAAHPLNAPAYAALLGELAWQVGLRHIPDLVVSEEAAAPMVLSPYRPVIVLPAAALPHYTTEELRLLLAHELLHIRRGDLWWMALATFTELLLFFNPLVWLAGYQFSIAREAACDSDVLRICHSAPVGYGRLLLKIVAARPKSDTFIATLNAAVGFRALQTRLMLLSYAVTTAPLSVIRLAATALLIAGAYALPWRLSSRPRLRPGLPQYDIIALPSLADAVCVNGNGQVIGRSDSNSQLLYCGREPTLFGFHDQIRRLSGPVEAEIWTASAINAGGDVVGTATMIESGLIESGRRESRRHTEAVVLRHGAFQRLHSLLPDVGALPASSSAVAINDAGDIVGTTEVTQQLRDGIQTCTEAFLLKNGVATQSGLLPGMIRLEARGVNCRDQVIGVAYPAAPIRRTPRGREPQSLDPWKPYPPKHGFLWENGVLHDLGPGEPMAINANGQIVGYYETIVSQRVVRHPCVWRNGTCIDLSPVLAPYNGMPQGINKAGQIVGNSDVIKVAGDVREHSSYENTGPFLYANGKVIPLNALLPENTEWLCLTSARAINDRGQIVGVGARLRQTSSNGLMNYNIEWAAYLMTPR